MMLASSATRRFVMARVIMTSTSCLEGFQSSLMLSLLESDAFSAECDVVVPDSEGGVQPWERL